MHTSKSLVGIVVVLLVAGVAVTCWQQSRVGRLEAENRRLKSELAPVPALRQELERLRKSGVDPAEAAQLRASLDQTKAELVRLRGRAGEAGRAQAEAAQLRTELSRQTNSSDTNAFGGAMGEMMKTVMEQQMQGRISRMKTKLNLTPEQSQAIQDILMEQASHASAMAQKVMSGKLTKEDMAKVRENGGNPEEKIKALLSPEQQTAYKEYKQEENSSNARIMANSELLQAQNTLGLSQEQQDKMFGVIYEQTMKQISGEQTMKGNNPADQMQSAMDQKLKALETVLTPEQLEKYRQMQESQLKFLKNIPGMTGTAPNGK